MAVNAAEYHADDDENGPDYAERNIKHSDPIPLRRTRWEVVNSDARWYIHDVVSNGQSSLSTRSLVNKVQNHIFRFQRKSMS